jgi:type II secretion system protein I
MKKTMKRRKLKNLRSGFTLTEVIVSIVILTVGLMAASSTLVAVLQSREFSRSLMTATTLAQKEMEEVRMKTYSEVNSRTDDFGQIAGYEGYRRVIAVTANAENTLKSVVVTVSSQKGRSITLQTLVARR